MDQRLNTENLKNAMEKAGFSQTALAEKLGVSREIVSKWASGTKFPRPDKLLRLALTLELRPDDLVIREHDPAEPIVAFRKRGAPKTTSAHIARARDMGRMLSLLVPYLPYDLLVQPATLKEPSTKYDYIQQVAAKIRSEIGVGPGDELNVSHLVKKFNDLQAVLIPVMWGRKDKHENALHIYLPDSMTTWVYLNLDTETHDFIFWMAHELAHAYAPNLRDSKGEDFADALAGALVFPETLAKNAYHDVCASRSIKSRLARLREYAECYSISLISVYHEINKYAGHHGSQKIDLGDAIFKANTNFNKKHYTVSETLFNDETPDAALFIQTVSEVFDTPFFDALKACLMERGKSAGFVQSILDTPLLDAKGIHAELT
ncbi:MAG: helix-turn-helix transcriptional regulator [Gammaproteobacteria bacterium]